MTRTTPSPEHAHLITALRQLKDRTGLSLAALAERTPYSKSSWERYLNGRTLPPHQAVRALCALAREPEGRCLALWEIAESEWSGRAKAGTGTTGNIEAQSGARPVPTAARAPVPEAQPEPKPVPKPVSQADAAGDHPVRHKATAVLVMAASVCLGVVAVVVAAFLLLPGPAADGSRVPAPASPSALGPRCRAAACEGKHPKTMRCSSDSDIDTLFTHRTVTGAWLELRRNPKCAAAWALAWSTHIGDRIQVTTGDVTRRAEVENEIDAEAYVSTGMVATRPGTVIEACFVPVDGAEKQCFSSRA